MDHFSSPQGTPLEDGIRNVAPSHYRGNSAQTEALLSCVRKAKDAADISLQRALEAPEPHETTNTIFIALWEDHLRDREALFAAMRELNGVHKTSLPGALETKTDRHASIAKRPAG